MDGRFSVDDAVDLGWPIPDNEEYETVAGFILDLADQLPSPGDVYTKDGYIFKVQSMRGRRIALLRVTAPEPSEPEEADEDFGQKKDKEKASDIEEDKKNTKDESSENSNNSKADDR